MRKLMLTSALAVAGMLCANAADQLNLLWLNDGVAPIAGMARQGVGHNGKLYVLNSQYGATGQGWIEVWGENGKEAEIQPEGGFLAGTNITIDDAGNIIARQGAFPGTIKNDGNVFVYNPETGVSKTFTLDVSKIMDGRIDFWGHVAGDVMSEEGGYLWFGNSGADMFNEVHIAGGEHVLGGQQGIKNNYYWWQGLSFGTTGIISGYEWLPGELACIEGPGAGTTPKPIHHMRYDKSGETWVWRQDGEYITPERNITSGFALFQLGGETYIVYSRGGNNADALAIAKARVQRPGDEEMEDPSSLIVAKTSAMLNADETNELYHGTQNTAVHFNVEVAADGKSAKIYQYCPRNFVAVYEFIPEQPEVVVPDPEPEVIGVELSMKWLNDDAGKLSGTTRQGVGHNGKLYLLNSQYNEGSQGWIEVWGENGKEAEIQPEGGFLAGTNITIDDAGNIIARQGAFPGTIKADGNVFVYNPETGVSKTFTLDVSKIMDGRIDFWGHVSGDVMSEEGGYLWFGNSGASLFNEVHIAGGEHVLGGQQGIKNNYYWWDGLTFGTTGIISGYEWLPGELACIEGPGAGTTPKPIHHMRYDKSGETWVWKQDGEYITPERNITSGFALFQLGGETYIVYSRGGNNADALAIAKARVQRPGDEEMEDPSSLIVAKTFAIMNADETNQLYNGTANTAVHFNVEVAADGKSALIYQYCPRNFVAVYEFKLKYAEVEEPQPEVPEIESLTNLVDFEDDTDVIIATPLTVIVGGNFLNLVTDGVSNIGLYTEATLEAGDVIAAGFEATYTQSALFAQPNAIAVDGKADVPAAIPATAEDLETFLYEWMYLDLQNVVVSKTMGAYDVLSAGQASMVEGETVVDLWIEDLLGVCEGMTPGNYNITGFFVNAPVDEDSDETVLKFVPTAYEVVLPEIESLTNLVDFEDDSDVIIATPLTVISGGNFLNLVTDGVSNIGLYTEATLEAGDVIAAGFEATYTQSALFAQPNAIAVDGKAEVPAAIPATAEDIETFLYEWMYLDLQNVVVSKTMEAYDVLSAGQASMVEGETVVDLWIEDLLGVCEGMTPGMYNITGFFVNAPVDEDSDETVLKFVPTAYEVVLPEIESLTNLVDFEDDSDVIIATPLTVIVAGGFLNLVTDGVSNIGLYTEATLEAGDVIAAGFEATYTQSALFAQPNAIAVDGKAEVPAAIPATAEDIETFMYEWMYLELENVVVTKNMEAFDILSAGQAVITDGTTSIDLWIEDLLGVCEGMESGKYDITGFFVNAPVSDDDDEMVLKFVPVSYKVNTTTGIDTIGIDGDAMYFDINGIRVINPESGKIYIKIQNNKAVKTVK